MKNMKDSFSIQSDCSTWSLNEEASTGRVDGEYILAVCQGPFFAVDSTTDNNRFYSRELWEKAISNNKDSLEHGELLGTIGHTQELDDTALIEGKASHKLTKLWIDEDSGIGMGEVEVLGTRAGRELNALLRGGVRLKVSSRADGSYKGKTESGHHIVDPDSYILYGFDFVQSPGLASAVPRVVESATLEDNPENVNSDNELKDPQMSDLDTKFHKVVEEKGRLEERLETTLADNTKLRKQYEDDMESKDSIIDGLKSKCDDLEDELESVKGELEAMKSSSAEKDAEAETAADEMNKVFTQMEVDSVDALMNKASELVDELAKYREIAATPEEIEYAMQIANDALEQLKDLGTVEELKSALEAFGTYVELGEVASLKEKLELLTKYEELGELEALGTSITESNDELGQYRELGTVEEIKKVLTITQGMIQEDQTAEKDKVVESIVTKTGISEEKAAELLTKLGDADSVISLVEGLAAKGEDPANRYRISEDNNDDTNFDKPLDESLKGSRAARLMANM